MLLNDMNDIEIKLTVSWIKYDDILENEIIRNNTFEEISNNVDDELLYNMENFNKI